MELVTSALTLLSVHAVFQFLCDQESTAATDTTELPELLVCCPSRAAHFSDNKLYFSRSLSLFYFVQNNIVDITLKEVSFY